MELPKETIERIKKEANEWAITAPQRLGYYTGAESEALRSLSEIEKLKEGREKRIAYELTLEDKNKELMEALKGIANSCDNQNPTHETIWRIAESLLKSLPNKEA